MLSAHTRTIGTDQIPQYQGLIRCTDAKGEYLWERTLSIARGTKEDALEDAHKEIAYIESLGA